LALSHLAGMAARARVALIRSRETPKRPAASPSMGAINAFSGSNSPTTTNSSPVLGAGP